MPQMSVLRNIVRKVPVLAKQIENDLPIANHSFNLSGLTNGVYYVVADNGTVRVTQKFIVK
jgi:hypothetical protein